MSTESRTGSKLAEAVQQITGNNVELAYVDQGYAGENAVQAAARHGIQLEVVKHREARRGFLLLPAAGWSNAASPGRPLPPRGHRLRTTQQDSRRHSLLGLRLRHAREPDKSTHSKLIGGSKE
jgi:hypothetical protein